MLKLTIILTILLTAARDNASAQQTALPAPLSRLFAGDTYTEYALLEPGTGQFRVTFMAEESPVGSAEFAWRAFEGKPLGEALESGLEGGAIQAYDPRTGQPIEFTYGPPGDRDVIRVALPRAVPQGGIGRVLIYEVFKDSKTYQAENDDLVWTRTTGAYRVGVVLPKGFALTSSTVAAQISTTADGRVKLAFANPSGQSTLMTIHAHKSAGFAFARSGDMFFDDVKTLYDLGAPQEHAIRVEQRYSDFRRGDRAALDCLAYLPLSKLSVIDLDTAQPLTTRKERGLTVAELATPIVNERQSTHLKITGDLKDPVYSVENGELVFSRTLHGLRNTVLLPEGWEIATVSQSGTIGSYRGRSFVALINLNSENTYKVTIRARKR
jgi:hypothetical protein